jgi:hypothetical protein
MREARDRRQVMFAERLERDVAKRDDLVVSCGLIEGTLEHRFRIFAVSLEPLLVCAGDPGGCILQILSTGVVTGPSHKSPDRVLGLPLRRFQLENLSHQKLHKIAGRCLLNR